ncbi:MAG: cytochrome ubiquinol oxidase subunit I [Anaerolineales bacterium]
MDPIVLSRVQFATTTIYHFFFVPLTLGLAWFIVILETIYVWSGNETYKRLAMFWGRLFLINFAVGVVTGIVLEFQFGMNWSGYARFVGDIFGAPLAIEALLAFFLESTFLGLWIFSWERISKGLHALTIWLVAIGSTLSALWILIANGFMQHPVGYVLQNGRAVMVDFGALVFNPKAWLMFEHTLAAGLTTGAFFVLGISAYHLSRRKDVDLFKPSFNIAAILGTLAVVLVILVGHDQADWELQNQPMKAASEEALYQTENPASFSVLTIFDWSGKREIWSLRIPDLTSLLYFYKLSGEVPGINNLQQAYQAQYGPGDYIPLVVVTYWGFRLMVGAGFAMLALGVYALYQVVRHRVGPQVRFLGLYCFAIGLPYLANTSGWLLTEMGRQPFIVYGLLKTDAAVSPNLTAGMVLFSLIGFALVYAALMGTDIYLLSKFARAGASAGESESVSVESAGTNP